MAPPAASWASAPASPSRRRPGERSRAVIDMGMAIRIARKRPRRHVGEQDHAAMRRQPLASVGTARPTRHAPLVLQELVARIVIDDALLEQAACCPAAGAQACSR